MKVENRTISSKKSCFKYDRPAVQQLFFLLLFLLLLLSSSSSSSPSPLCRVFILIFLRKTMSLGNTVLQLLCCYYSWCLYSFIIIIIIIIIILGFGPLSSHALPISFLLLPLFAAAIQFVSGAQLPHCSKHPPDIIQAFSRV